MLVELNKQNAPTLLLEDFNYFFNKAINQYINKRYNIYDTNQQTTDDLRVLKSESILEPTKAYTNTDLGSTGQAKIFDATYEVILPSDYLHILNCICIFKITEHYKCYNAGDSILRPAKRLTADSWSVVCEDYFNRPSPRNPYYYIHNVNTNSTIPTNPVTEGKGTDMNGIYGVSSTTSMSYYDGGTQVYIRGGKIYSDQNCTILYGKQDISKLTIVTTQTPGSGNNSNFPRTISLNTGGTVSTIEKETAVRYGNASQVRMEIRYGNDTSVFQLEKVQIDYIKTPQYIRLTQEQVNLTRDTSQVMEFPDYVCQEIINELTNIVMANIADPRLQTHIPISTSIAQPAQQQQPQPTRQQAQ